MIRQQIAIRDWSRKLRSAGIAFMTLLGFCAPAGAGESGGSVEMRGFQLDFRQVSARTRDAILPSLEAQLEIVERANVPAPVLEFFKTIPIIIDPKLRGSKGHAQRIDGQQTVTLQDERMPRDKPILLHELLHGYFAVKLRGRTPAIAKAFREAQAGNYYPREYYKAHFLENPNEYFTIVSSIFLFGKIDQPPHGCAMIKKHQPEFIELLESHFGPHECRG